jgi:hypothetical protein
MAAMDKFREKVQQNSGSVLEPDEQIEATVLGETGIETVSPIGNLLSTIRRLTGQKQAQLVIATDRNLYLTRVGYFSPTKVRQVIEKQPWASASVKVNPGPFGGFLHIGDHRLRYNRPYREDAERLAEKSSGSAAG